MWLTLRTLLALRDGVLAPQDAYVVGGQLAASAEWQFLERRIGWVLAAPQQAEQVPCGDLDAELLAAYLDGVLSPEETWQLEAFCCAGDGPLAELAACHQLARDVACGVDPQRFRVGRILALVDAEFCEAPPVVVQPVQIPYEVRGDIAAGNGAGRTAYPNGETAEELPALEIEEESGRWSGWTGQVGSGLFSACVHLIILVLLALVITPLEPPQEVHIVEVGSVEPEESIEPETIIDPADAEELDLETPELQMAAVNADASLPSAEAVPILDAGAAAGGGDGLGGGAVDFFGVRARAMEVVFVVDASGSMSGPRSAEARLELVRAIRNLNRYQKFRVIFFNNGHYLQPVPDDEKFVKATSTRLRKLREWLQEVDDDGGTRPTGALRAAEELGPDTIFFLSDGAFERPLIAEFLTNIEGRPVIHTIAFKNRTGEERLKELAESRGGTYRFVE